MPPSGKGRNMGFDFGLEKAETCFKRKHRWLLKIPNVSADGVSSLPPSKAARPNISFKEAEAQHVTETIYFPTKPDWKPVNLVLYEVKRTGELEHPVLKWIDRLYNPSQNSTWRAPCGNSQQSGIKIPQARLEMYDGCGTIIETWIYESVWPQAVEFGDLDMSTAELVVCELTLRYDRAYIER